MHYLSMTHSMRMGIGHFDSANGNVRGELTAIGELSPEERAIVQKHGLPVLIFRS